ncbi:hypothetical protein GCM10009821_28270 [Aeromicrobium halocynthiae]|uniref:DUF3558 domain-containing protein n=1 Tax=Aeromicrobium halocynthiae TaxID=560557 RepID=A0ABN2WA58_9ACTN
MAWGVVPVVVLASAAGCSPTQTEPDPLADRDSPACSVLSDETLATALGGEPTRARDFTDPTTIACIYSSEEPRQSLDIMLRAGNPSTTPSMATARATCEGAVELDVPDTSGFICTLTALTPRHPEAVTSWDGVDLTVGPFDTTDPGPVEDSDVRLRSVVQELRATITRDDIDALRSSYDER